MHCKFVSERQHTGRLIYFLVWQRRWIPTKRYLFLAACNRLLNLEICTSDSDVTSISLGNGIFFEFSCRLLLILVCCVVTCFLIIDRKISSLEIYGPVVGIVWRKATARDIFFSPSKCIITSLDEEPEVSYKDIRDGNVQYLPPFSPIKAC